MKKAERSLLFVVAPGKEQEMQTARTPTTLLGYRAALISTSLPPIHTSLLKQRFHRSRLQETH